MCSRHPEEGAGSAYRDPPQYLEEWREWAEAQEPRPVWIPRAQYGGWDRPQAEVSNAGND